MTYGVEIGRGPAPYNAGRNVLEPINSRNRFDLAKEERNLSQNDRSFTYALDRLGATLPQEFDTIDLSRAQNLMGMGLNGNQSRKKLDRIQLRKPQDIINHIEQDYRRNGSESNIKFVPPKQPFMGFKTLDTHLQEKQNEKYEEKSRRKFQLSKPLTRIPGYRDPSTPTKRISSNTRISRNNRLLWDSPSWPPIHDNLQFGSILGQGSFSRVYTGFDTKLNLKVAIKIINKSSATKKSKRDMIQKEVDVFAAMDHPNIAKLHRVLEDAKRVKTIIFNTFRFTQ